MRHRDGNIITEIAVEHRVSRSPTALHFGDAYAGPNCHSTVRHSDRYIVTTIAV